LEVAAGFSALSTGNLTKLSPATEWFKQLMRDQVRLVSLDPDELYAPAPPALKRTRRMTGSYLASAVFRLATVNEKAFSLWLDHVRTVLPDIEDVFTALREEDRHRHIMVRYRGGVDIPSWVISEGTLRLFALTILPYLPDAPGALLIEEPENTIHPAALEQSFRPSIAVRCSSPRIHRCCWASPNLGTFFASRKGRLDLM
jgi:putative AbiEii toxin of type IV toxin-antitoxin system